ncbi:recombinase family protein [uncultured Microbacterium sp.]|uniref:recombinase family protein n=1 Tax=uncultured Microbacterium sp. TaxID=191216 RepID=UPI0025E2AAC9|nr:recombinase family protein [uncultured Microbacterium sp.]
MSTTKLGYIRLSRDDAGSQSIENQKAALLAYDPRMQLFIDRGVSGEINLDSPTSAWTAKLMPVLQSNPSAQVVVYSLDRLGRSKGAVLYTIEKLIRGGGTLYVVRDDRLYNSNEDFEQAVSLTFASLSNEAYRVEIQKKTQRALDVMKSHGVRLGRPPALNDKQVAAIRELHGRGLGYASIGKVVRTTRADGSTVNTSPRIVRAVVGGAYVTREQWERRNKIARLSIIEGVDPR